METLSATSLEVGPQYPGAGGDVQEQIRGGVRGVAKTVALDPNFGLGIPGWRCASRNLDRQQDAERYIKEALRHLDWMTERERYRTRGLLRHVSGDYQAA